MASLASDDIGASAPFLPVPKSEYPIPDLPVRSSHRAYCELRDRLLLNAAELDQQLQVNDGHRPPEFTCKFTLQGQSVLVYIDEINGKSFYARYNYFGERHELRYPTTNPMTVELYLALIRGLLAGSAEDDE